MATDFCAFRGDKKKWDKFVEKVKSSNIPIWTIMEVFIDEYLEEEKKNEHTD